MERPYFMACLNVDYDYAHLVFCGKRRCNFDNVISNNISA